MKKIFLLLALVMPMTASAYDAEIGGIYYNLITKAKQAEVTSGDTKYTGSVTIPDTVTYNGVTYNVTSIENGAFLSCPKMTSVTIGNSVTSIGNYAFYNCSGLTSIDIPNSVTSIGYEAFYGCSKLTSVHITDLESWCKIEFYKDEDGYYDDYSNPLYYARHLFMNDKEITDLVIPDGVTSIGALAFEGCRYITSVTIPNSVTSVGYGAFSGCFGLTEVHITNLEAWCNINFQTPIGYVACHLFLNGKEITDLVIPNSVTSIKNYAFRYFSSLTSVTIPNGVTSIGESAFAYCTNLTSVNIPNSVTSMGSGAFYNCSGLTSITLPNSLTLVTGFGGSGLTSVIIPNSVTLIGNAFHDCSSLTSVTIGSGVKKINDKAFSSCSELKDVYCYAENVPTTSSNAFADSYIEYATLYVPEGSVAAYKAAEPWSTFGTIKTLSGEIPVTPKCATPTIAFIDGKLSVDCETEDVKYVYNIVPMSPMSGEGLDIALPTSFKVTIYAMKDGYENSEVATKEINVGGMGGIRGDVNEDGGVDIGDLITISNIMAGKE